MRRVLLNINNRKVLTQQFITKNAEMFQFEGVSYVQKLCWMLASDSKVVLHRETIAVAMKHCATLYQNELHRRVQKLRLLVSEQDWNQLVVIVTGAPSPRSGHSAMQYFSRLTGKMTPETCPFSDSPESSTAPTTEEHKHERQLFYVENVYPVVGKGDCFDQVLDIVAQEILERRLFDKVVDMKTDVLAFDTQAYLAKMCKK